MAQTYQEPVKITVEMAPSFTVAALNKCLIITKEHKTGAENTKINEIKTFSTSAEVGEWFGNNSETFKAVEFFLGQKRYPAKQPLVPDFFTVLSVDTTKIDKSTVLTALNGALGNEFYAVCSLLTAEELAEGDLNSWLNENRKIQFAENTTKTIEDEQKSDRLVCVYNAKATGGETREYKAISYMATCITPGAGSKSDMNILNMCSADISGGERQDLTSKNINFTEKRTSKDYIVVRNGVGTDGTDITETTALDCIIYNLIDNLEIAMSEEGFKMDSEGVALLENVISKVMGEMYNLGLIADTDGQADFKVLPTVISATDRQLKRLRPKVQFVLADYAKLVELTLERTLESTIK